MERSEKKKARYAIRLRPGMTAIEIMPYIDRLDWLQEQVRGHIQLVVAGELFKKYSAGMLVNEEGKYAGMEYNRLATKIYKYGYIDQIVGPALIVKLSGENFEGFTIEETDRILHEISAAGNAPSGRAPKEEVPT